MRQFEYEISVDPADAFRDLVYFCSQDGSCSLESIPSQQLERIRSILNRRGQEGWELVHITIRQGGILAFWKRMINTEDVDKS